jgi:hypothetical protein
MKITEPQWSWLNLLKDGPQTRGQEGFRRATKLACEKKGWAELRKIGGSPYREWHITDAGREALTHGCV